MRCVHVIFSNRALPTVCREQPRASETPCLRIGRGRFLWVALTNKLIKFNPFLVQEASFSKQRYLVEVLPPQLFGESFYISFLYLGNLRKFYCSRFPWPTVVSQHKLNSVGFLIQWEFFFFHYILSELF